jgi:hypothetical protein
MLCNIHCTSDADNAECSCQPCVPDSFSSFLTPSTSMVFRPPLDLKRANLAQAMQHTGIRLSGQNVTTA